MASRVFEKRPEANKDFHCIWTEWLEGDEEIALSAWTVPAGLTAGVDSINADAVTYDGITYRQNTVATIFLSGGEIGRMYELVNQITTDDGRIDSRSLFVQVVARYTGN